MMTVGYTYVEEKGVHIFINEQGHRDHDDVPLALVSTLYPNLSFKKLSHAVGVAVSCPLLVLV